uniref:Uncharacterized protein n=1 Tax=Rhizophora mucronata TaxID=61149 RepID=A0A2P2N5C7_RHIMU
MTTRSSQVKPPSLRSDTLLKRFLLLGLSKQLLSHSLDLRFLLQSLFLFVLMEGDPDVKLVHGLPEDKGSQCHPKHCPHSHHFSCSSSSGFFVNLNRWTVW